MGFIKTPNLPDYKVTHAVCGRLVKPFENELEKYGIKLIYTDDNPLFSTSLKSHADLFFNYLGNGRSIIDFSQSGIKEKLNNFGLSVGFCDKQVKSEYPDECLLNCVITDDIIICNKPYTDIKLIEFAQNNSLKTLNVAQGYCKCSVLPVTTNAFITDDISIYNALKGLNYDVLCVEKGSIVLSGYNYGFIGGCAFKMSKSEIAFCGNIDKHKNSDRIKSFLNNYKITAISLSDGELTDVGSIIPIKETGNEETV